MFDESKTEIKENKGMPYAGAFIHFLDRKGGEVKSTYYFPIVEIELITWGVQKQMKLKVIDGIWKIENV